MIINNKKVVDMREELNNLSDHHVVAMYTVLNQNEGYDPNINYPDENKPNEVIDYLVEHYKNMSDFGRAFETKLKPAIHTGLFIDDSRINDKMSELSKFLQKVIDSQQPSSGFMGFTFFAGSKEAGSHEQMDKLLRSINIVAEPGLRGQ
jgi:hypothetical protein